MKPMAKTKGTHVLNAVKVLRQDRERARKHLAPHLHRYLDERILPSSWYPMEDHLMLLHTIAKLFMPPGVDPWLAMGRGTARMDLAGVYRLHLRPGDPGRTLQALSAVWKSVHDSGEVTSANAGPATFVITMRGFSRRAPEICGIIDGYVAEVVNIAGGVTPKVLHERCCCRGADECVWRVSWNA